MLYDHGLLYEHENKILIYANGHVNNKGGGVSNSKETILVSISGAIRDGNTCFRFFQFVHQSNKHEINKHGVIERAVDTVTNRGLLPATSKLLFPTKRSAEFHLLYDKNGRQRELLSADRLSTVLITLVLDMLYSVIRMIIFILLLFQKVK